MFSVNGFYGHVRRNDLRSIALFLGFLVAFQVVVAMVLLVPLIVIDRGHAPFYNFSGYFSRYGVFVVAFGFWLFALQFFGHVGAVKSRMRFHYVDRRIEPRLVNIVETLAIAAGLPRPKVAIIDQPARNAFACGVSASGAVVVVTRGLLDALDDDELSAVIAHEVTHIARGDIRLMAAANVLLGDLLLMQQHNPLRIVDWRQALLVVIFPPVLLVFLGSLALSSGALTLARVSRLLVSQSREYIADAEAVRMTHNPAALISALRKISGRSAVAGIDAQSDAMMIDGAADGPLATHPDVDDRIAVLTRLSGSMAFDAGSRKDTRPLGDLLATPRGGFGRRGARAAAEAPVEPRLSAAARIGFAPDLAALGWSPQAPLMLIAAFGGALIVHAIIFAGGPLAIFTDLSIIEVVPDPGETFEMKSAPTK